MIGSSENRSVPFDQNEAMQAPRNKSVEQFLEQFHADFDPVYNTLMDYQCAAMEVETKFNILNNRLSIQGEHNPIESVKSRIKSLDSIVRKILNWEGAH